MLKYEKKFCRVIYFPRSVDMHKCVSDVMQKGVK